MNASNRQPKTGSALVPAVSLTPSAFLEAIAAHLATLRQSETTARPVAGPR